MNDGGIINLVLMFLSKVIVLYLALCCFLGTVWVLYYLVQMPYMLFECCWRRRDRIDTFVFGEKRKTE